MKFSYTVRVRCFCLLLTQFNDIDEASVRGKSERIVNIRNFIIQA